MPLNDDHSAIFLHVPKTGGTAIRDILNFSHYVDENPETIPSPQHLTCDLLRYFLGTRKYNTCYKFSFVRNPWGRLLSDFFWRKSLPAPWEIESFDEFVELARVKVLSGEYYTQPFDDHFIPQVQYTVDVDDVFRFENFKNDVREVARKLGIEPGPIKKKTPKPQDSYWEFYSKRNRDTVANTYAADIEMFGYQFEMEAER